MRFSYFCFTLFSLLFLTTCRSDPKETTTNKWTRTGDNIEVRMPAQPRGLNVSTTAFDSYSKEIVRLTHQYLLYWNAKTLVLEPMLAKGVGIKTPILEGPQKGNTKYEYEIFEEAKWDDGTPITGHDVAFTYKSLVNPLKPNMMVRSYLNSLVDIIVDEANPKKLTFIMSRYMISEEISYGLLGIMPSHIFDANGALSDYSFADLKNAKAEDFQNNAALQAFTENFQDPKYNNVPEHIHGSGPYEVVEWVDEQKMTLKKKENWWGASLSKNHPQLEAKPMGITYKFVKDMVAATAMAKGEELDLIPLVESADFVEMKNDERMNKMYNFISEPTTSFYFTYINTKKAKLSDKRVRRALAHCMDVDEYLKNGLFGLGIRMSTAISPSKPYYNESLPLIQLDIAKAKELLTEAGWTDSNNNGTVDKMIDNALVEMKLEFLISETPASFSMANALKNNARKAGIEIEIVTKAWKSQIKDIKAREYDLAAGALRAQPILDDFHVLFHSSNDTPTGSNRTGMNNPELDQILVDIQNSISDKERFPLYTRLQEILYDEQPMIFLVTPLSRTMAHKRIDFESSRVSPGYYLNQIGFVQDN